MLKTTRVRTLAAIAALALLATACPQEPQDTGGGDQEQETDTATEEQNKQLDLGYILPETGQLAFLGPPQINAVKMAVEDMNKANGVLGQDVTLESGDEAGDATVASETAERLLAQDVDAIIGAAASAMSLAIIDQVTGQGVVQCSASNTGIPFTDYEDNGFYFRTAPTDALQGPVLAETIVGDGNEKVALMARADEYGEGLLNATKEELEAADAEVVADVLYDPEQASFDSAVEQVQSANPDAVALIAFDEGAQILQTMIEAGIGPDAVSLYGADGLRSSELPEEVDPGNPNVLDGMKGTAPDPSADPEFIERLKEFSPGMEETVFAAQAYDCTTLVGLAAEAAGTADPAAMKKEIVGLTKDGEKCESFQACKKLLGDGKNIDYDGPTGKLNFTDNGEPKSGSYEVWQYKEGELVTVDTVESSL